MTVRELIEVLDEFPSDLPVLAEVSTSEPRLHVAGVRGDDGWGAPAEETFAVVLELA